MALSLVTLEATAKHTSTFIFLHGLGDTGHGWSSIFDSIRPSHMKLICPTAPTIPITINDGDNSPAWFDSKLGNKLENDDEFEIKSASSSIHQLINSESQFGIPFNRMVVGGFSQGGALALYSSLTLSKPLACVIALSCWLPLHKQFPSYKTASDDLPIFQAHGQADEVLPYKIGHLSANMLNSHMRNCTFKSYSGLDHGSSDEELDDVMNFIGKYV